MIDDIGHIFCCRIWLGMRDLNPRIPGPEPGALPLGQSPILVDSR